MQFLPKLLVGFYILFIFLRFPSYILAAELSISNLPLSIEQTEEFEVDVSLLCSGCGDSYIRGVFFPSGTNSYFGYTQSNDGSWSNEPGGNCNTYFKIAKTDLEEGTWSGKLNFKPDIENSYYSGPGEYAFKLGRYTPSCSSPSVWSEETTIAINGPTPSPTPAPTSTPTPTPTPTKQPTVVPSLTLTASQKFSSSSPLFQEATESSIENFVFATSSKDLTKNENNKAILGINKKRNLHLIFIATGVSFILICGILFVLKYKLWKKFT